MESQKEEKIKGLSRKDEELYLKRTLEVVKANVKSYERDVSVMQEQIEEMLERYHDNDAEVYTLLSNTITMRDNMAHALRRNQKALKKPYFGRIDFYDETYRKAESLYIGRGGIARDTTHQMVVDWRAPVATAYYENGLGKCSYRAPEGKELPIDLKLKRTYEIEGDKLLDFFDTEVIANDDLLTKYLAKNKQAVLGEIIATIQKEQNEVIRKSPFHNMIVQGVAGSGKTTVAMHRISYILYNYAQRFKPDDFYIVGSNRILLEYITGVLPDLDVYGIRQMTMEQLFVRLLYEDWDEKKYRIRENVQGSRHEEDKACIRGTGLWFRDLEAFCRDLEKKSISEESIFLNPKQFVEGIRDGVAGVFDDTVRDNASGGSADGENVFETGAAGRTVYQKGRKMVELLSGESITDFLRQNPALSVQSKINLLNERLLIKIKDEFLKSGIRYTEKEQKAILKAFRGLFGKKVWKYPIYDMYRDFLREQIGKGYAVELPEQEFDVYDLAALAYLYKRIKETEVISEAHHVVIDEAQDFGMMAYAVLDFCIKDCTYTIMGDVSQNIHFGYGLNDWEELKGLLLLEGRGFEVLKKSYRNTVEISEFAMKILGHGSFTSYPAEPIIRHGSPVMVKEVKAIKDIKELRAAEEPKAAKEPGTIKQPKAINGEEKLLKEAAALCKEWQAKGYDTIAIICRNISQTKKRAAQLAKILPVTDCSQEDAVFTEGVMVLPVSYTKGLEFDAVLILDPDREDYPVDDGHARLLYVAATRALHELCVLHQGNLTGLIADPVPEKKREKAGKKSIVIVRAQGEGKDAGDRKKGMGNKAAFGGKKTSQEVKPPVGGKNAIAGGMPEGIGKAFAPENLSAERRHSEETERDKRPAVRKPAAVLRPTARLETPKSPPQAAKIGMPTIVREDWRDKFYQSGLKESAARKRKPEKGPSFGDMPPTEKLRPMGHSKIDLSVKWVAKQKDGLYLQSRYGILRLCPVGAEILRVTFSRRGMEGKLSDEKPILGKIEKHWMYKESGAYVELFTEELSLQVDKITGAIQYKNREKKLLLSEKGECRLIEEESGGRGRSWLFLDVGKKEHIYAPGMDGKGGLDLSGSARYISSGNASFGERFSGKNIPGEDFVNETAAGQMSLEKASRENVLKQMPLIISDKGYGILMATGAPTIFCNLPAYGSWLSVEGEEWLDFYFFAGKSDKIFAAAPFVRE